MLTISGPVDTALNYYLIAHCTGGILSPLPYGWVLNKNNTIKLKTKQCNIFVAPDANTQ